MFIKANSRLEQKRGMKNWDPLEDNIFASVIEDEDNEWITGVVQGEVVAEAEQVAASKRKRVFRPRKKKLLPVYVNDELQSAYSSSDSEDDFHMHSPSDSE